MKGRIKVRPLRVYILAAGMFIFASTLAWAGGVKVIANPSVSTGTVSVDELRSVFLQEKNSLADGTRVEPVLARGGAAHEVFLKQYLERSGMALQTYYRSLVFTGKGSMPKEVGSEADMVSFVARTKGAIGYVSAETNAEGVKTLQVK